MPETRAGCEAGSAVDAAGTGAAPLLEQPHESLRIAHPSVVSTDIHRKHGGLFLFFGGSGEAILENQAKETGNRNAVLFRSGMKCCPKGVVQVDRQAAQGKSYHDLPELQGERKTNRFDYL